MHTHARTDRTHSTQGAKANKWHGGQPKEKVCLLLTEGPAQDLETDGHAATVSYTHLRAHETSAHL
eukprot:7912980-Alexandrium_andersonii.AAC.1